MYLKGIITSVALLSFIAGGTSEPQCAFSIPALLKSGETVKGCLEVKRHSEPVSVNIILEVSGVNYTIANEQVPAENTFKCLEFQVPNVTRAAPVFLTITAIATNFNYTARRPVVVAPTGKITLIQLERSIYKPGQEVSFNVIALDNNLKPVDDKYPLIYITDPSGNRLFQWIDQAAVNGILSLSFSILDDPDFGSYTIQIEREFRDPVSKTFTTDEYVLPNFGSELSVPNSITILDKSVSYSVTSKYTYGQGVPGKVSGRMCRTPQNFYPGNACNRNPDGLCVPITGELDSNGTLSGELDLTPFQLDRPGYSMSLTLQVTVIEEGSGIQVTESKVISITNQLGRVSFNRENMEQYYKKGLPYYVEVTAKDGRDSPLSDEIIELQVDGKTIMNLTTDANGKAKDFIDTSELDQPTVSIQVNYKNSEQCYDSNFVVPTYSNDYYSITRAYSRSGSFVQIEGPKEELQCGETYNLTVKYIFSKSGLQEGETTADFSYMTMSRTKIIDSGKIPADLSQSLQGEFSISVQITPDHAPGVDVIVYYMMEKEIVTSTIHLNTEKCFSNQVSLEFAEQKGKPGSTVNLDITSASHSLCAVRVYDSSLLLLQQDQALTPAMVYSSLQYNSLNGYYIAGYNVAPPEPPCIDANKQVLIDGLYWSPVDFQNEEDTFQELSSVGMLFITNTTLRRPALCGRSSFIQPRPVFLNSASGFDSSFMSAEAFRPAASFAADFSAPPSTSPGVVESVRSNFAEMWFFNRTEIGESGSVSLPMEVPGTITEWKGDMVCLNSAAGFGMTKYPANFTSYQEFFVSESLPYSIVRGEILIARVILSSTLPKCAKVRANISSSDDYTVEAMDEENVKCICSGQRATFSFSLNAKSVGVVSVSITGEAFNIGDSCDGPADPNEPNYKDTVIRTMIVEAEGVPNEVTKSNLVCVKDTTEVIPVSISPPENSVEDSVKVKVTVIGDILGRALVNPESLINDPKACGEQNLATLIPIVLVLEYLKVTGRLTEEIRSRAVQFMGNGYRRQLRYRNYDGSFSAFGPGRSDGSSWLTLLTLATFERIKPYTMVEDRIANQALVYLEGLRDKTTGGYRPKGTLFNNALKGGAEDDVSFTAAMAAYLLQTSYAATPTLLREAMNFLDGASRREQSVYNLALLLYVFRVAGNEERSNATFTKLKELQIEEGGTIHWERPNKPNKPTSYIFSPQAASGDIEITSYVLLAMSTGPSPPLEDLSYMSQIALWLSEQQTSFGSYSSTADTMVALQAMCSYGTKVYQKDASNTVEVKSGDAVVKNFNLDSENRNLLQTYSLPNVPGDYSMTATGNGCVLLQTTVNFNIPVNEEDSAFLLSVSVPSESCVDGVAYTLPVSMNVSYNGLRNESNMALIDMDLPSGYTVEYQSLVELRNKVPKVEQKNNHVIIYLESVSRNIISLNLTLRMNTRVQNFQPKYIMVWDYYEKDENGIAVLRHPCSNQ
ncbi:ovostatin-like [Hyla sarda]|uniref:ovostatin-like n=1 Tax=Hyla sarda TaxID=327740 RepID=UPI0024C27D36|nr:ovostatin-like [Hyla sarda]